MKFPVVQPPWSSLGKLMESSIRRALYDFKLFEGCKKVAVALSGGKDSLTLLYMLKAISGRGFPDIDLSAIHVSGEFSCGAGIHTQYLKGICDNLGVQFVSRESHQKLETLECYSCSRERRKLLFEAAKSLDVDTIAFGHHRDDYAQTVLMNLLQKAEFEGTHPKIHMHKYGITIIRPLIYVKEQDIRTFSEQNQFARVMCRCPVGQNSMRKKVDTLLTEIEDMYPHARGNITKAGLRFGSKKALKLDMEKEHERT